jgi:hypothetical protein
VYDHLGVRRFVENQIGVGRHRHDGPGRHRT